MKRIQGATIPGRVRHMAGTPQRTLSDHALPPCVGIVSTGSARPKDNHTKNKITRKSSVNFQNFHFEICV